MHNISIMSTVHYRYTKALINVLGSNVIPRERLPHKHHIIIIIHTFIVAYYRMYISALLSQHYIKTV